MPISYEEHNTVDGCVCVGTFVWKIGLNDKCVVNSWLVDIDSRFPTKNISVAGPFLTMDIGMALSDPTVTGYAEAEALLRSTALHEWVDTNQYTYEMRFVHPEQLITIKWRMVTG
jgi:hypothetical protein